MTQTPQPAPGLKIGSLRGVPVFIGRSWVLIAVVIVFTFGPQVQRALPELGTTAYVVAFAYVVGLLISVLVHEAAHALAGQWRGFEVHQIVADLWGGHTSFTREDSSPASSAIVAVGPSPGSTPMTVPTMVPRPPLSRVPPMTTAAIASSS